MADYDVCVIGSGAGGGVAAWALAKAGLTVHVLEKGPLYSREELEHDEIRDRWLDHFKPYPFNEPQLVREGGSEGFVETRSLWPASCVGGGTTVMSGFFYRMWPEDFRMKSLFGNPPGASVADWPISYDDLEPYYTRIEDIIGVSGKSGQHPFEPRRSKPYPLPPLKAHPLAALIDEAAGELGLHPFPTPRANLSRPFRGRSPCVYHADCGSYGCPVGAKSGTLHSVLPEAVRTGKCTIVANAMVYKLETGGDDRVKRAVYYDADGRSHAVSARCFVAACTALGTARLLLNSKSARFPQGLGNNNGLVGRHLNFSTALAVYAKYRKEKRGGVDIASNAPFLQRSLQDYYIIRDFQKHGLAYPKGGTFNFIMGQRSPVDRAQRFLAAAGNSAPHGGDVLKDGVLRELREYRDVKLEVFQEFLPSPRTYVDVDEKVTDKWGVPAARVTIGHHPAETSIAAFLAQRGRDLLMKTAPEDLRATPGPGTSHNLQHGTCRFGEDPSLSVLDADCRAHEVGNLYAADGSFMPTSGGVPSTFTIMANSLRVSGKIVEAFRRNEL